MDPSLIRKVFLKGAVLGATNYQFLLKLIHEHEKSKDFPLFAGCHYKRESFNLGNLPVHSGTS